MAPEIGYLHPRLGPERRATRSGGGLAAISPRFPKIAFLTPKNELSLIRFGCVKRCINLTPSKRVRHDKGGWSNVYSADGIPICNLFKLFKLFKLFVGEVEVQCFTHSKRIARRSFRGGRKCNVLRTRREWVKNLSGVQCFTAQKRIAHNSSDSVKEQCFTHSKRIAP